MGLRLFSLAMIILASFAVASCGGGGGSNSSNSLPQESTVTIQGSGIKGILANATVSIYELNTSLALSYDPAFPIAIGVTNSVGMSASLEIPTNISRPLVLVVDGASSIDLNSNQVPVITKLTSIFTIEDALAGNPIFATPYTTIAHEMAKSNSTSSSSDAAFQNNFATAITDVGAALGFGAESSVDFLTTPAVLSEGRSGQMQQAAIIQHRAAIEALAAVVVELRTASGNTLSSADVVLKLAEDLFNDGLIDGDSGLDISAIPTNVENLYVPGTQVQIKDIGIILESDRQYTGANTNSVSSLSPTLARPTLSSGSGSSTDNNSGSGGNSTEMPAPVISFSASNVNFGRISMGASATNSITLTNIGNAPLTITSMTTSGDFSQTNACSGYVPSGQSCTINVTFTPVSSENRSGLLSVSGNMTATRTVSLLGVGDSGASSANTVLDADFERLSRGAYRESDLRSDFNVNSWRSNGLAEFRRYRNETVHGPNANSMDIVADPANSGRGNVLRVLHREGRGGNDIRAGGFRFRADLPPSNEYYFAYDFFLPFDWVQPLQHKMPGMINGTLLEASHTFEQAPTAENLVAFTALMQSHSQDAFGRGDGSLAGYIYDKDRVQTYDWLNTVDPSSEANSGQYVIPRGRWIKIEQYMKVNTGGQKNGELKIWVDGVLLSDQLHRWRDASSTRLIDGVWMYGYYGGNPSDPRNRAHNDQYQYYDNFIVSDSPITH